MKRGHALSYAGIFLFTIVLYARPAEFYPSRLTASLALMIALATLSFFIPTQLSLEGTLTARPAEVNLLLLFCVTGLLSIPLAVNPPIAWQEFSGTFIRCVIMFVVIVNVVRTKTRLKWLLFLALGASLWLSVQAISDYHQGLMTIEGYRASGRGTGIFGNTNDMALHVVTRYLIAIALLFGSKGPLGKLFYGVRHADAWGIVLSYSRGAFISLIIVVVFIAMRIGPRHRLGIVMAVVMLECGGALVCAGQVWRSFAFDLRSQSRPGGSSDAVAARTHALAIPRHSSPVVGNWHGKLSAGNVLPGPGYSQLLHPGGG